MSRRLRRMVENKKNGAAPGTPPAPAPQPVDEEAAKLQIEELKRQMKDNARTSVLALLEAHKVQFGVKGIERATIAAALDAFFHLLNNNKKFVPGPHTDFIINLAMQVIPDAAAAAREKAEEKRIITLA